MPVVYGYPPTNGVRFEPDTLLPSQVYAQTHHFPEKRFFLAILEDAVYVLQSYALRRKRHYKTLVREAWNWLYSDEDRLICSFLNIYRELDLNPAYLRRGVRGYFLKYNIPLPK